MKIAGLQEVNEFSARHARAQKPLKAWVTVTRAAECQTFADLKATFGSVDKVGAVYVFNVGGNKYRLLARITFALALVRIRGIYTHDEYDKLDIKQLK